MRKILYIHGNSNIIGGIENFTEWALFYHKKFEPHIIFINDGILPQRIKRRGFKNIIILNGGRLRHIHKTISAIFKISEYIKRNKIDIVIGQGQHAWIYAGLGAKLTKVKSIFYCRGILDKSDVELPNLIGFISLRIKPSLILANSMVAKESVERYMKKVKAEVLYPGIDLSEVDNNIISDLKKELALSNDAKVISMIGRIQEGKGQEYFIKAIPLVLKEFPDVYFLVVGSPTFEKDNDYLNKIRQIVISFNYKERVIFTGFRDDIPEIIALSDILVCSSTAPEGFGIIVTEGMAAGKPVIATNIGGPVEIITNGRDGVLIPPKDAKALAKAIITLLENDKLMEKIGYEARKTVIERFSIDKCIEQMEDVLEKIL